MKRILILSGKSKEVFPLFKLWVKKQGENKTVKELVKEMNK